MILFCFAKERNKNAYWLKVKYVESESKAGMKERRWVAVAE